jgi:hypothetical protein
VQPVREVVEVAAVVADRLVENRNGRWQRLSKATPKGVAPLDAETTGAPTRPSSPTGYTSIVLDAFSVTTSELSSGENCTSAGPELPAPSGVSESRPTRSPVTFPAPPALTT